MMDFYKIEHIKKDAVDGDLLVCELMDDGSWNVTGVTVCVYFNERLYDQQMLEGDYMWFEGNDLTDKVTGYDNTGKNVEDLFYKQ